MKNTKNITIAILLLIIIWFSTTIIRLENYHYANQVGMCDLDRFEGDFLQKKILQTRCFNSVETRTSPMWHLYYALSE